MVKRNLQMEEEAMKLMISKTSQESINMDDQSITLFLIIIFYNKNSILFYNFVFYRQTMGKFPE